MSFCTTGKISTTAFQITTDDQLVGMTSIDLPLAFDNALNGMASCVAKIICRHEDNQNEIYAGALIEKKFFIKLNNGSYLISSGNEISDKDNLLTDIELNIQLDGEFQQILSLYVVGILNTTLYWFGEIIMDSRMIDPTIP